MTRDPLSQPLFKITDEDYWLGRHLVEGIGIFASPGVGKTSIVGKLIALELLRARLGFIVVTAKASEVRRWKQYAKETGREKDLIIFSPESGLRFDPMAYEFSREGVGRQDPESVLEFLTTIAGVGKVRGNAHDPFWEDASEHRLRVLMVLLKAAGEPVSITHLQRLGQSMPSEPIEDLKGWMSREGNYCGQVMLKILERRDGLSESEQQDVDAAWDYLSDFWPSLAPETRGSIDSHFSSMAGRFMFAPFRRVFSSGVCDFTPRDACNGKIIVISYPLLQFGQATGALVNSMVKLAAQRDFLRRDIYPETPLTCLWLDEAQLFFTRGNGAVSKDNLFQQSCRESRIVPVYITQNISNIAEAMGEDRPGSKTYAFLGNVMLKIFLQQNDIESNRYAADLIGQEYRPLKGSSGGVGHSSESETEHLLYKIDPHEFTELRKPDPSCFACEAIVYQGGQPFRASRRNYLRCTFRG